MEKDILQKLLESNPRDVARQYINDFGRAWENILSIDSWVEEFTEEIRKIDTREIKVSLKRFEDARENQDKI